MRREGGARSVRDAANPSRVVDVQEDRWLSAAATGARLLGLSGPTDVEVYLDDRVGWVNPRCVTH